MFIPDPRWEEPNLLIPGKKPTGPVVVDRDHWAGRNVVRATIPTSRVYDVVAGEMSSTSGAAVVPEIMTFDGTAGNSFVYGYPLPLSKMSGLTILLRVRRGNTTINSGLYDEKTDLTWSSDEGLALVLRNTDDRLLFRVGSEAATFPNTGWSVLNDTTSFWDVAATWEIGAPARILVNSKEPDVGYNVQTTGTGVSTSTNNARIGTYYDGTASRTFTGDIVYVIILDKALSNEQIANLHRNPYQILCPA